MNKDKKNLLNDELIRKMDNNISNKKVSAVKVHNCANKPGVSCNCIEREVPILQFEDFCRIVDFYLKHCDEALDVVFYDRSKAYFAYLADGEMFHDAIVEIVNEFKDDALNPEEKEQKIMPLNSACQCTKQNCKNDGADLRFEDGDLQWLRDLKFKQEIPDGGDGKSGVERVFEECLALYKRKNHDYSNHGESAFDKAYKKMGAKSLWLRLNDKFTRFESLLFAEDEAQVKDEKIEDTLLDLINYAAMGLAKLKGYDK